MPAAIVRHFMYRDGTMLDSESAQALAPPFVRPLLKPTIEIYQRVYNIESVFVLPFPLEGPVEGMLTFDMCRGQPVNLVFSAEERDIIREVAAIVTSHMSRSQAEKALHTSEVRYRRLFEAARDGILILDAETGMVVDVNPFLVELLGFPYEAFLGKKVWELGFFKDIVANQDKFVELQQKGYVRYENLPLESADGRRIQVEFVSNVYLANDVKVIQCNIRDITERRHTVEKMEQQLDELRRWHEIMLGRETRVIDLKREVNELLARAGEKPRYESVSSEQ